MAIDKVDWHSGGDFPTELPYESGGTHIGMYLAWVLNNDLYGEFHRKGEFERNEVQKVLQREITGRDFLLEQCDSKFWNEDLSEEGKAFTEFYYSGDQKDNYFGDYCDVLGEGVETMYHVEDSWGNYDLLEKQISRRFKDWKRKNSGYWWQFWK